MVLRCPSTSKAISEQTKLQGCNDTLTYHCLKTENGDLIEKCLGISWIQKGNCAVFNSNAQQVDAVKCNENLGICPQKQYLSNEVMSYSACVQAPDVQVSSFVPTKHVKGGSLTTSKPPSDVSDVQLLVLVPIVVAVLVVIVAIVLMFVFIKKRRKRSPFADLKVQQDAEMTPLQNPTERNKDTCSAKEEKDYDLVPYYKTKRYEYLENRLINSAVSIIVIGEPGSGKSVLRKMLYTRFWNCKIKGKYHTARYLNLKRLKEMDNYQSGHNTKTVNILENCLEVWNNHPHLITPSFMQIQHFHEKVVKDNGNCLVITISKMNFENNLDAAQRAQLKSTEQLEIVDLSEEAFQLDITDKIGILEYHRNQQGSTAKRMDDKAIRKITDGIANYVGKSSKLDLEFPLSCHLYYKHDTFQRGEEFFMVTKQIIKEFVKKLSIGSHEEKSEYCTLMYVTLCGGQIETWKKQDDTLLKAIAKKSEIDTSQLEFNYGCCLITEGAIANSYEIIHEEISKLLFSMFCERHAGMVIDTCEVEVLMKFVRTDDKCRHSVYRKMGFLIITHNLYNRLAARLQGIYDTDQRHAIFRDTDFCRQFKKEGSGNNAKKAGRAKETEFSHQENVVSNDSYAHL